MIKENKFKVIVSSIVILLPILFGVISWEKLPEKIATHWGPDGNPDHYSSKFFAVFCLPIIVFLLHWLCLFISKFDPKNKDQHKKVMGLVFWICPAVSILCSAFTYFYAFDVELNVGSICIAFMGLFFIIIGNYMPKTKHNFTIGIRIPTTLASEENWYATHRFAGRLWVIGGIILLPLAFLPANLLPFALIVILPFIIAPIIYSYCYSKKNND